MKEQIHLWHPRLLRMIITPPLSTRERQMCVALCVLGRSVHTVVEKAKVCGIIHRVWRVTVCCLVEGLMCPQVLVRY